MKGVVALMRAPSVSGRGLARTARRPAKVVRIPTASFVRRRNMARLALTIGAVAVISGVTARFAGLFNRASGVALPPEGGTSQPVRFSPLETRIIELINAARVAAGVEPLAISDRLAMAARSHARDMADHRYVGLEGAGGDTPADRVRAAGLDYDELAENLMSDRGRDLISLPQRTLDTWLASPRSRNNLLAARFRATAVAIAQAADGSLYMTLDLMR